MPIANCPSEWQGHSCWHGLGFQVSRIVTEALDFAGRVGAQERQIGGTDATALGFERMQRLGLIDDVLERDRVRDEFVVDDGFLCAVQRRGLLVGATPTR